MVLLVPLFCSLGIWQLHRAEQKRALAAELAQRLEMPALPLSGEFPGASELEYRKVSVHGRFLPDRSILIENRKYMGKTGFHLITPMQLAGESRIVLINRGWIPQDHDATGVSSEPVSINGEVRIPQKPALELQTVPAMGTETPHWPYLTLEHYREWSGLEVLPFMVLQTGEDEEGFVRLWPKPEADDGMHIGYAIQWFAFALIAVLIWLRLSLRRELPNTEGSPT